MFSIAIVDDNKEDRARLEQFLVRYQQEKKRELTFLSFSRASQFLTANKEPFDLVFMDIEMPNLDGMEASRILRKNNQKIIVIFVTNMAQFAVNGYEVGALDFIIKPIIYENFCLKMEKAYQLYQENQTNDITIVTKTSSTVVDIASISFVEVSGHHLTYHIHGNTLSAHGSLSDVEAQLGPNDFLRCNNCYLVNPHFVEQVKGLDLQLKSGEVLRISRLKKKEFMSALANWVGRGNKA